MKASYIAAVCAVMVLLLAETHITAAVTCSPTELTPCAAAISSGSKPSAACCSKLKEQKPCFCQYLQNPSLKPYVNSPNAKKVAKSCGVAFPKC